MRIIAIAVLLGLASLAIGQLPPPVYPYAEASAHALATRQPMVTWVGSRPRHDIYRAVTTSASAQLMQGYPAECVVVARPAGDAMWHYATLPVTASKQDIMRAIEGAVAYREVPPARVEPFRVVLQQPRTSSQC